MDVNHSAKKGSSSSFYRVSMAYEYVLELKINKSVKRFYKEKVICDTRNLLLFILFFIFLHVLFCRFVSDDHDCGYSEKMPLKRKTLHII